MNEDIKQLIERECEVQKDIHWNDFGERADAASRLFDEAFAKGFNSCLSKWKDSERWRKVEEELPDKDGMYLVTTDKLLYAIAEYIGNYWVVSENQGVILRWKPIND